MLANAAKGLPAERIGEAVKTALTSPKPKVRYTVAPNPLFVFMIRHLPRRMVDKMIARQVGLNPPS